MVPDARASARVAPAGLIALIIVFSGLVMWAVTTFLFHFSSSQGPMGPIVDNGALAVVLATALVAVLAWRARSPDAAVGWTGIATIGFWAIALFVEWQLSFMQK